MSRLMDIHVLFVKSFAPPKMPSRFTNLGTTKQKTQMYCVNVLLHGAILNKVFSNSEMSVYSSSHILFSGYYSQPSSVDEEVQSKLITIGKSEFQCADCGQTATIRSNMWRHIEAKHIAPQPIPCQFCGKTCPSRNALASHCSRYHRYKK